MRSSPPGSSIRYTLYDSHSQDHAETRPQSRRANRDQPSSVFVRESSARLSETLTMVSQCTRARVEETMKKRSNLLLPFNIYRMGPCAIRFNSASTHSNAKKRLFCVSIRRVYAGSWSIETLAMNPTLMRRPSAETVSKAGLDTSSRIVVEMKLPFSIRQHTSAYVSIRQHASCSLLS